jgi:heptosyltransferase-1
MKGRYLSLVKGYFKDLEPYDEDRVLLEGEGNLPFSLKGRVLIAPFSKWESKEIPLDTIRYFLEKLEAKGYQFCLIYQGNEEGAKAKNVVEGLSQTILLGNCSLVEIQKGAKEALGAICADSALLHLFSLAGVPLFSLFGPSSGSIYSPKGQKDEYIQGVCPYLEIFEKRCSLLRSCKEAPCLRKLPKETSLISIEQWLSRVILS